jgi:predicted GTPase
MTKTRAAVSVLHHLRWAIVAIGLLAPVVLLVPAGTLWLWQQGLLVYWALAACISTLVAFMVQRRLTSQISEFPRSDKVSGKGRDDVPEAWSPRELAAWNDVLEIAQSADGRRLSRPEAALDLAQTTIKAVAKRLHPESNEAMWQFTLPEALALTEQVSSRLKDFIVTAVPLGDRLTVAQAITLYRRRGALESVELAYDLWRIVRLINPLTAASQELRESFSKKLYELGRDELGCRLLRAYVREVGRAAIDLYSGRLKVSAAALEAHVTDTSRGQLAVAPRGLSEPLRILIVGQTGVGKSSLVNALLDAAQAPVDVVPATKDFATYQLEHGELSAALLIDSPPLGGTGIGNMREAMREADLILWVASAVRPDRQNDRTAIETFRRNFESLPDRHAPPVLAVLTGIDLLRPFRDWCPPYDLRRADSPKAVSINAAVIAVAEDLALDISSIVPVSLRPDAAYNIDALWAKIFEIISDAQRARLVRTLRSAERAWDWRRVLAQAGQAGRVLVGGLG